MAITRWEPFPEMEPIAPWREMERWQRRMNRLFERLLPGGDGFFTVDWMPAVEMEETENEILLKLEIPGLEAKDLDIQVKEMSVTVTGERKEASETEEKGRLRSEFSYGSFKRVIPLPAQIQNDRVKAEYHNGILTLTLPKTEEEKHKTVKVELV